MSLFHISVYDRIGISRKDASEPLYASQENEKKQIYVLKSMLNIMFSNIFRMKGSIGKKKKKSAKANFGVYI